MQATVCRLVINAGNSVDTQRLVINAGNSVYTQRLVINAGNSVQVGDQCRQQCVGW